MGSLDYEDDGEAEGRGRMGGTGSDRARVPGFGLQFEADAAARSIGDGFYVCIMTSALSDGELENGRMPHSETRLELEVRRSDGTR